MMIVSLIGYRGCGKSSVAPFIANALQCGWVDSDREIERRAEMSIAEIFAQHGEQHFRDLESEVLQTLVDSQESIVIAAGGGAILREQNRIALKAAGPVVWLTAKVEVLAERIQGDAATDANRPSLTGAGVVDEINQVLEARLPLYQEAATAMVSTDDQGVEQIGSAVLSAIGVRADTKSDKGLT